MTGIAASATPLVRMADIRKRFGENHVLRGVSFDVRAGEVHALLGENGAGKSTLMKVLMGVHEADSGRIELDGQDIAGRSVRELLAQGIAMIFQELSLLPNLTVGQNLLLGREPRLAGWRIDARALRRDAQALIDRHGFDLRADAPVRELGFAQRQMVEVLKAVSRGARVLIMDEPTSSLSLREETQLFAIIEGLQARGMGLVYISHRMAEVFRVADRISIVKDGLLIGPLDSASTTPRELAQLMSKSTAGELAGKRAPAADARQRAEPVLRVRGLRTARKLAGLDFEVGPGEVVGVAGLVGAGRSTLAKALFGLLPDAAGAVEVDGRPVRAGDVPAAIAAGIGFVPEDRRHEGLMPGLSLADNLALPGYASRHGAGIASRGRADALFARYRDMLHIACRRGAQPASELSGGNQQKVVFGKWLATAPRLLILDEPTNGVDVNAKAEMRAAIRAVAAQGVGVLLISSELDELTAAADRVLLMVDGRISRSLTEVGAESELRALLQADMAARQGGIEQTSASAPRLEAA